MVKIFKAGFLLLAFFAAEANAAFDNEYDFSKWSAIVSKGQITTQGTDSVTLVSSNTPTSAAKSRNQDFTFESEAKGTVSFDWLYNTTDNRKAKADPFGWLLNGVFTALTSNNGPKSQQGSFSFDVNVGDIFGFRINSTDSKQGAATATVSNFSGPAPVPAPAALWLMMMPAMALLRKKQKA
jgi:hypothetical protein